ncbi:unnamed protein product [Caenorhabditis auriculariae]|uniref:Uncharacterized protein n=1 Tax=Caenorhabditis auriculariae TaxID=2777116 RepID=A0A8S1HUG8_9PELO|nr:unnamed protein product [Caenorhabditis auriculariae]
MMAGEALVDIISIFCTCVMMKIIFCIRPFHVNMTHIYFWFMLQYFQCPLARWLLLPYEQGWVRVTVLDKRYASWYTEDVREMPHAEFVWTCFPLILGGFFRFAYIVSVVHFICIFALERTAASYFLR